MDEGRALEQTPLDKMKILEKEGMVDFDIEMSPREKESIQEIKIEKDLEQFNYYGPADEKLLESLVNHFSQLEGNSPEIIESISNLIAKIAQDAQKDFNQEAVWAMVRVSLPNNEFDTPRWHKDGRYTGSNHEGKEYKLVFTVKGAPTRFAKIINPEKYKEITENPEHHDNIPLRKELMLAVEEIHSKGQAVLYLVDNVEAKVHSEPPISEPRIFISVVPGSIEGIEQFKKRYEE